MKIQLKIQLEIQLETQMEIQLDIQSKPIPPKNIQPASSNKPQENTPNSPGNQWNFQQLTLFGIISDEKNARRSKLKMDLGFLGMFCDWHIAGYHSNEFGMLRVYVFHIVFDVFCFFGLGCPGYRFFACCKILILGSFLVLCQGYASHSGHVTPDFPLAQV